MGEAVRILTARSREVYSAPCKLKAQGLWSWRCSVQRSMTEALTPPPE